jgi:hypothetical protein
MTIFEALLRVNRTVECQQQRPVGLFISLVEERNVLRKIWVTEGFFETLRNRSNWELCQKVKEEDSNDYNIKGKPLPQRLSA